MTLLEVLYNVTKSISTALYQYFWASLLFTAAVMTCYMFVFEKNESGQGVKKTLKLLCSSFRRSGTFRLLFFLVFYTSLICFRTLLHRGVFTDPWQDFMGGWQLYYVNRKGIVTSTSGIENMILFMPFSFLLCWFLNKKNSRRNILKTASKAVCVTIVFSVSVEVLQLILFIGTTQLADMVYNSAGGVAGVILYLALYGITRIFRKS